MFRNKSLDISGFFPSHHIVQLTLTENVNVLFTLSHFILEFICRQLPYTQSFPLSLLLHVLRLQGDEAGPCCMFREMNEPQAILNVQGMKTDGQTSQNIFDEICLPSSEGLPRDRSELIIVVRQISCLTALLPYHASWKSHPK